MRKRRKVYCALTVGAKRFPRFFPYSVLPVRKRRFSLRVRAAVVAVLTTAAVAHRRVRL